ncbi:MAG: phosphatidylserine decarboxylase family protein [Bacteroidia bacterium]|jgi:phosphatidylserine decarboxylase|nr:phosphatidylserine decarboxylase family protein [Bacteroidia bacterium]MDG1746535.1 phosphatidylserine decarboxylase family protein [Bacteroidia bacterium]
MKLHREGFKIIFITLLVLTLINFPLEMFFMGEWYTDTVLVLSVIFFILIVQFFRDPHRETPVGDDLIIAPADGKVVVIEEVDEPEYLKTKCRQISIFMSPVNVHVNRYPTSGKVLYEKYHPGKYLVAWHPKSSTENERTTVVVEHPKGQVLFRQIAGALAKRIVNYAKVDHIAKAGAEYGFIKFGSRIDIYLPLECEINVELNQKTVGGETVIARWS